LFTGLIPARGVHRGDGTFAVPGFFHPPVPAATDSPFSDFVDLTSEEVSTSTQLFQEFYTGGDHVAFQTCIEIGGSPIGGRLFVIADPIGP
jgi:hypothetical protein